MTLEISDVQIDFSVISPCPDRFLPKVWEWLQHFSKETLDVRSPKSLEQFLAKEKADSANGGKTFAVILDGQLVGAVWFENVGDETGMGHLVFDPGHHLSTLGKVRATREAIRHGLESFRRILWQCFADNRAFRLFLKRVGVREQGVFEKHASRNGEWIDVAFMASFPGDK